MPAREAPGPGSGGLAFLSGSGPIGRLVAALDWPATPLGPIGTWPQSVRTTVALCLGSKVPMATLWGRDGILIYNEAYAGIAGGRHPHILGSPVRDAWPEAAGFNQHVLDACLAGGTLAYRDQEFALNRCGTPEQVYLNLDYSPILDESGEPIGVIAVVVDTTAKVAAERWHASERDRQRQMFEQAPGFMAMLSGPEHRFEVTNAAYRQLVGHRDVVGKTVREALPEIAGQGYFELLDEVFATGRAYVGAAMKASLQHTPGDPVEQRFIDLIYQPVRDPDGEVFGIFVQGVDVTDRLLAEQALRESEAQFRMFAEAMPNHVWTSATDGQLDWFNPRVYDYSGTTEDELLGDGWASIVHPDDIAAAAQVWRAALATETPYEVEFRLRRRDGAYRWHLARAVPMRDSAGSIVRWIGTNTDIDDQKRAVQALRESERRLQLSQNAAGIAALELHIDSGMVYGSDNFWSLWGLSQRDSVHISVLEDIVLPEDRDIRSNPETRREGSAAPNVEYRIRRPDTGEIRWLSRNIDFMHDEAGRPVRMFGVMQDITERKEAQARQQILTYELEHRIKNILAMVSAIASQTMRNSDIETARAAFNERLRALANAHDILNSTRWTSASMHQVIEKSIAVFPVEQITVSGPALAINPKMALSLALAVNELGTNALKYGGLSTPGGAVSIEWRLEKPAAAEATLTWRWRETGGPPVMAPSRKGFGSFLIGRVFGADFGGSVRVDYHPDGVECVLTAPAPGAGRSGAETD